MDNAIPIAREIVAAYQRVGDLAVAYGQGSLLAGFDSTAGLDLVLVWDRVDPPPADDRPVHQLHDGRQPAMRFMQRDRFAIGGHEVNVAHRTKREFEDWRDAVHAGRGWEVVTNPAPLYAISGFVYGVLLADLDGSGSQAREKLFTFPEALRERSASTLSDDLTTYESDLVTAAKRGDGWLFHELLGNMHRHAMVAWFAAERRYCPYPKWLQRWIARFNLDPRIAMLERSLWTPPVSLHNRVDQFRQLVDRVLKL